MPYASVDDIRVDLGPGAIPVESEPQVQKLIARAEARIRQAVGDPDRLITSGRTDAELITQVISEMVAGVLRNRNAWQSGTETKGPYSRSHTVNLAVASGLLRLTAEQRALLGERTAEQGAFTVRPGVPAGRRRALDAER